MAGVLRLRKHLSHPDSPLSWPPGISLVPLTAVDPGDLYALLSASYANGSGTLPPRDDWWPGIVGDAEFDPDLVFVAADGSGAPIGIALCWNSAFLKDFAVARHLRGQGIGQALLQTVFAAFRQRGFAHVDLKVVADNAPAISLYRRMGMVEAPL